MTHPATLLIQSWLVHQQTDKDLSQEELCSLGRPSFYCIVFTLLHTARLDCVCFMSCWTLFKAAHRLCSFTMLFPPHTVRVNRLRLKVAIVCSHFTVQLSSHSAHTVCTCWTLQIWRSSWSLLSQCEQGWNALPWLYEPHSVSKQAVVLLPQSDLAGLHVFCPHYIACCHVLLSLSLCIFSILCRDSEKERQSLGNRLWFMLQLCESLTCQTFIRLPDGRSGGLANDARLSRSVICETQK